MGRMFIEQKGHLVEGHHVSSLHDAAVFSPELGGVDDPLSVSTASAEKLSQICDAQLF